MTMMMSIYTSVERSEEWFFVLESVFPGSKKRKELYQNTNTNEMVEFTLVNVKEDDGWFSKVINIKDYRYEE